MVSGRAGGRSGRRRGRATDEHLKAELEGCKVEVSALTWYSQPA